MRTHKLLSCILIYSSYSSCQIAAMIFGCAELLMGFNLRQQDIPTSFQLYVPFWQGVLVGLYLACHQKHAENSGICYLIDSMFTDKLRGLCTSANTQLYASSYVGDWDNSFQT